MYRSQPYYVKQSGGPICQRRINTMVYYLFPKCLINMKDKCRVSRDPENNRIISPSQFHYMREVNMRITACQSWNRISQNPYTRIKDAIFIPDVVGLVFYEILELYTIMHFSWKSFYKLNTLHFGNDAEMTMRAFQYIRTSSYNDSSMLGVDMSINNINSNKYKKYDIAFCHASSDNEHENGINVLKQILVVLTVQKRKGACIIKFGDTFTQLSLDIISFVSHFYEKTYIMKPSVCDLAKCDKYIVCKNFIHDELENDVIAVIQRLQDDLTHDNDKITRILDYNIPLFFSGKLEEINSIFGQPRLEYIHQLLSNPHSADKANKQRCADWCTKYLNAL